MICNRKFKQMKSRINEKHMNRKEKWNNFFKMIEESSSTEIKINERELISALKKGNVSSFLTNLLDEINDKKKNIEKKEKQDGSDDDETDESKWDMIVNIEKKPIIDEKQSIYIKFLRSKEKTAAVWRPEEVCTNDKINEMSLSQRGELIANMIAKDFCDWLRNLGGLQETAMDEEILKELFQIGLENPAARSVCVKMMEKPTVSYHVAEAVQLPKRAFHVGLQRQLLWDIQAEKTRKCHSAFGSQLHPSKRWQPPDNKTWKRWLECGMVPEQLVTFSLVFEGITNLKSVKEYYEWLIKNPQYKIPSYLQQRRYAILDGQNTDEGNTSQSDLLKYVLK